MIHLLLAVIYLSFISLGLPDGLLGAAWPSIYPQFQVPVSWSGMVTIIIALGTVCSSLLSDRVNRRFGTGTVTAVSVALTAAALLGFAGARSFAALCLWAIPYGLGAGGVDAGLNGYVALHYESRHMSWLHCMWGIGASIGPLVMGAVLTGGQPWNNGYLYIGLTQSTLLVVLLLTMGLWKNKKTPVEEENREPMKLSQVLRIPGAWQIAVAFFCNCALEQTYSLWTSSYLVLHRNMGEDMAATCAGMFYLGVTVGRFLSGFLTMKLNDQQMIWLGAAVVALGTAMLLVPAGNGLVMVSLLVAGLGNAPIFPCVIHSTPEHFGAQRAQALVGIQMASANLGICLMPPLFGLIANSLGIGLMPVFLLLLVAGMAVMFRRVQVLTAK